MIRTRDEVIKELRERAWPSVPHGDSADLFRAALDVIDDRVPTEVRPCDGKSFAHRWLPGPHVEHTWWDWSVHGKTGEAIMVWFVCRPVVTGIDPPPAPKTWNDVVAEHRVVRRELAKGVDDLAKELDDTAT